MAVVGDYTRIRKYAETGPVLRRDGHLQTRSPGSPPAATSSPASYRSNFSPSTGSTAPLQSTSPHGWSDAATTSTSWPISGQSPVFVSNPASKRNANSPSIGFGPSAQLLSPQRAWPSGSRSDSGKGSVLASQAESALPWGQAR